ncbi:MAG: phosphodiester glycosidase family protein [candidate division KSB1 bacterium]|nr:phosphodiester glycosidase family protein [candidate division KSB1 bacterium]
MRRTLAAVSVTILFVLSWVEMWAQTHDWMQLESGLDVRFVEAQQHTPVGNSRITVVGLDPGRWQLVFIGRSNTNEPHGLTAREWCARYNLKAAINAGMFGSDYKTHPGFLRSRGHTNSAQVNSYQSVAAFDPRPRSEAPPFHIFDLDEPGASLDLILQRYQSAVQNLRLIKRPGKNRWGQQENMWSEAALGEDSEGRILFIFSRSPFTMHDLNRELLSAEIGIVAAQHLEGGPEAQLYLKAGGQEIDLFGSFETGFREDDTNT